MRYLSRLRIFRSIRNNDYLFEKFSNSTGWPMRHYHAPFDEARTRRWIEWNLGNYKAAWICERGCPRCLCFFEEQVTFSRSERHFPAPLFFHREPSTYRTQRAQNLRQAHQFRTTFRQNPRNCRLTRKAAWKNP